MITLKVYRDIDEMSGFNIELNDWDNVNLKFKHSDSPKLRYREL